MADVVGGVVVVEGEVALVRMVPEAARIAAGVLLAWNYSIKGTTVHRYSTICASFEKPVGITPLVPLHSLDSKRIGVVGSVCHRAQSDHNDLARCDPARVKRCLDRRSSI